MKDVRMSKPKNHVFLMHAQLRTTSSCNYTFNVISLSGLPHNDYHSLVITGVRYSTLWWVAQKRDGRPYISIASDELKSLVIYTDKL